MEFRGVIEMTKETFEKLSRYMKAMPFGHVKALYYTGYPISKNDAKEDAIISPEGKRIKICL